MTLYRHTEDYLRGVLIKVEDLLRKGQTNERQITRALSDEEKNFLTKIREKIWIELNTLGDRKELNKFSGSVLKDFTGLADGVNAKVVDTLRAGIKKDVRQSTLIARITDEVGIKRGLARTLTETGEGGIQRYKRVEDALAEGFTYFRYDGAPTKRPFCIPLLGKVFHINDILKMQNGTSRLAVKYFCGGYNCRHRWTPVADQAAVTETPKPKKEVTKKAKAVTPAEKKPKTLKELTDYSKKFSKDVSYGKIDADIVEEVVRSLEGLFNDYKIGKLEEIKPGGGKAWASANGRSLSLNRNSFFNKKKIEEKYNLSVRDWKREAEKIVDVYSRRLEMDDTRRDANIVEKYKQYAKYERHNVVIKGKEIESVITHEIGHTLYDQTLGGINPRLQRFPQSTSRIVDGQRVNLLSEWRYHVHKKLLESGDIYKISAYAEVDSSESFAEAFTMYRMEKNKLPEIAKDYFDRFFKFRRENA